MDWYGSDGKKNLLKYMWAWNASNESLVPLIKKFRYLLNFSMCVANGGY